jgi:ribosomal protein S18 acetylase RimI-like enzyme
MNIHFRPSTIEDMPVVEGFIWSLYKEDDEGEPMSSEKIKRTVDFLKANPSHGTIISILADGTLIGYSILINYWSNEFGGIVLYIDELYIQKDYRNKKIGTDFIQHLKSSHYANHEAIFLEVFPSNAKAYDFYKKNGFELGLSRTLRYKK